MSMQNIPCSGYIVKASDLTKLFSGDKLREYQALLNDCDSEKIQYWLEENMPSQYPPIEQAFLMDDESEFQDDELEKGVIYVMFDESNLYKRVPTVAMSMLSVEGVQPKLKQWVAWG